MQTLEESIGAIRLASQMLEFAPALGVVSYGLAAAAQFVFVRKQTFQANWPAGMKLAVADSKLGAQAIAEAIGKPG